MRRIYSFLIILLMMSAIPAFAQKGGVFKSRIVSTDNTPLQGAIVSVVGTSSSAISDENGNFELTTDQRKGTLRIVANGYYTREYPLKKRVIPREIVLVPDNFSYYAGTTQYPFYSERRDTRSAINASLDRRDMKNSISADLAWQDGISGLQVVKKSGMPGEGAFFNLRGIHTLVADNAPLLVINGIPYFYNSDVSNVINGYSRDALFGYNANDIKSITALKGAEAAMYGSLGSNGVILIETQQATSDNLNTRISFTGNYGVSLAQNAIPSLDATQYRSYLQDIGMTRYSSAADLRNDYPFLNPGRNAYSYLFDNNIDWNKEITRSAFVTDNVFRIEGGDEIAKYNISLGYTNEGGIVDNTSSQRFHTLINSDVMVSRWVDIFTNVNLAYITSDLQEQGMKYETNPLLAATFMMPNLYPYTRESNGNLLSSYATYNSWNVNKNPVFAYDNVSNPLALVNTVEADDKIYDVNVRAGLNWRPTENWTITGMVNIYYDYTEESLFVPGVTDQAIVPQLYGTGFNYVSKGVRKLSSYFYGANAMYEKIFNNIHDFKAYGGVRLITRDFEYDFESGYNTANDNYKTLSADLDERVVDGNNDEWKWLSYYLHADYTFNHLVKAMAGLSIDGTTVSGLDAARFGFFPSAGLTFFAANTGALPSWIDMLNLSAEVSLTGNSRFSSNYAKNYYLTSNLFNVGTIVRSNVPNTRLEWEKKLQFDGGLDLSLFKHLVDLQFNYFYANSYDLLLDRNISSVYGSSIYYDNTAEISTQGYEFALRLNPVHTKDFDWVIAGNIATAKSTVESLGNTQTQDIIDFKAYNEDDAQVITKVGRSPYEFYGYETNGVYATTQEALASGLKNSYGNNYRGGDVRFVDQNHDGVINDEDRVSLGSATPDFFGGLSTTFRYKWISLKADFGYSVGNKAYNATRRMSESMSTFYNQSTSVLNRWQVEGQVTDMPRAAYGDPSGNNFFSDRWVEDASYFKLRALTLAFHFDNKMLKFCQSGTIYVTGENLFTATDYLGSDPEFNYSYSESMRGFDYAKVSLPITIKVGFNLNF